MPESNNYIDWLEIVAQLNHTLPGLASSGTVQLTKDGTFVLGPVSGSALTPIQGNYDLYDNFPARQAPPYTRQSAYLSLNGLGPSLTPIPIVSGPDPYIQYVRNIFYAAPGTSSVFDSYKNFRSYVTQGFDGAGTALWESGIQQDFDFLTGIDPSHASLGGWEDLVVFPPSSGDSKTSILVNPDGSILSNIDGLPISNYAQVAQLMMANAFNYFINHYNFPSPGPELSGEPARQLAADWQRFLATRTSVDGTGLSDLAGFPDFLEIYNAFNPTGNPAEYKEKLVSFYREMVDRDGYFLPSHHLGDWIKEVQQTALVSIGALSSISGTGSKKTLILVRLFLLLVEMIEQMQRVTAAQAGRLKFYAAYQKAYTQLLAHVPVLTLDNIRKRAEVDGEGATKLAQAVQALTSQWTEIQRGYRSVVGDESKEHQTAVNQSNEMVNQQAQLGTSILQQMSTILTTIFK